MRLTEPSPIHPTVARRSPLPVQRWRHHGIPHLSSAMSFSEVLERRRSTRSSKPLRLSLVLDLLSIALASRADLGDEGGARHLAPTLSAGALHAVQVIIVPLTGSPRAFAFDRRTASVGLAAISGSTDLQQFRDRALAHLPHARGAALAFVADLRFAEQAYDQPESLLWRDAGAMLQTIAMVACSEGFAFCPLGCHGDEVVSALKLQDTHAGVGAAVLGIVP